ELRFLPRAGSLAARGASYEAIRRGLISYMYERKAGREPVAHSSWKEAAERAALDDKLYVNNASEALAELMRLGLVVRTRLPSSATAARAQAGRTFQMTDAGVDWAEVIEEHGEGSPVVLTELLPMLWKAHPRLAAYVRLLASGTVFAVPYL